MNEYRYWLTLAAILVVALLIGLAFAARPAMVRWLELRDARMRKRPRARPARPPPAELGGR